MHSLIGEVQVYSFNESKEKTPSGLSTLAREMQGASTFHESQEIFTHNYYSIPKSRNGEEGSINVCEQNEFLWLSLEPSDVFNDREFFPHSIISKCRFAICKSVEENSIARKYLLEKDNSLVIEESLPLIFMLFFLPQNEYYYTGVLLSPSFQYPTSSQEILQVFNNLYVISISKRLPSFDFLPLNPTIQVSITLLPLYTINHWVEKNKISVRLFKNKITEQDYAILFHVNLFCDLELLERTVTITNPSPILPTRSQEAEVDPGIVTLITADLSIKPITIDEEEDRDGYSSDDISSEEPLFRSEPEDTVEETVQKKTEAENRKRKSVTFKEDYGGRIKREFYFPLLLCEDRRGKICIISRYNNKRISHFHFPFTPDSTLQMQKLSLSEIETLRARMGVHLTTHLSLSQNNIFGVFFEKDNTMYLACLLTSPALSSSRLTHLVSPPVSPRNNPSPIAPLTLSPLPLVGVLNHPEKLVKVFLYFLADSRLLLVTQDDDQQWYMTELDSSLFNVLMDEEVESLFHLEREEDLVRVASFFFHKQSITEILFYFFYWRRKRIIRSDTYEVSVDGKDLALFLQGKWAVLDNCGYPWRFRVQENEGVIHIVGSQGIMCTFPLSDWQQELSEAKSCEWENEELWKCSFDEEAVAEQTFIVDNRREKQRQLLIEQEQVVESKEESELELIELRKEDKKELAEEITTQSIVKESETLRLNGFGGANEVEDLIAQLPQLEELSISFKEKEPSLSFKRQEPRFNEDIVPSFGLEETNKKGLMDEKLANETEVVQDLSVTAIPWDIEKKFNASNTQEGLIVSDFSEMKVEREEKKATNLAKKKRKKKEKTHSLIATGVYVRISPLANVTKEAQYVLFVYENDITEALTAKRMLSILKTTLLIFFFDSVQSRFKRALYISEKPEQPLNNTLFQLNSLDLVSWDEVQVVGVAKESWRMIYQDLEWDFQGEHPACIENGQSDEAQRVDEERMLVKRGAMDTSYDILVDLTLIREYFIVFHLEKREGNRSALALETVSSIFFINGEIRVATESERYLAFEEFSVTQFLRFNIRSMTEEIRNKPEKSLGGSWKTSELDNDLVAWESENENDSFERKQDWHLSENTIYDPNDLIYSLPAQNEYFVDLLNDRVEESTFDKLLNNGGLSKIAIQNYLMLHEKEIEKGKVSNDQVSKRKQEKKRTASNANKRIWKDNIFLFMSHLAHLRNLDKEKILLEAKTKKLNLLKQILSQ